MKQVFISYSSKEVKQANEIVEALEKQGIDCWIAPRDIRVGSNYTKDIPGAIRKCPCFLLVLSAHSQESKWVNKELTRAINQDKRIMPLMIEDFTVSEGFEFLLEDVQIRPYYRTKELTMQEVLREIRVLVPQAVPVPKPAALSAEECFQKGEAAYSAKNYAEAVKWYQKAADQEYAPAQCALGYCYDTGSGFAQNHETAVMWYQKAAGQGYARAQHNLGVSYEKGEGVGQDYDAAFHWYQKAADQGDADAQINLGVCYRNGYGVTQNDKTAVMWYKKAADQGDVIAQYNMALCYRYGRGVEKNLTEAKKWYQQAAERGHEKAKKALEHLK